MMSTSPNLERIAESQAKIDAAVARQAARKLDYVMAEALPDQDQVFKDELIEATLGRATMAVLYGDANSGKTFAAIDLGASVARGVPWLGRPSQSGLVLYLATEAAASVELRLRGYQRHHSLRVPDFVIVKSPINLFDQDADTNAVIALVAELELLHDTKTVLIIGDTLARISAGANENSGQDMSVVMQKADAIRSATGATFLWIHHCGKEQARGMRGWSGMRAAIDTEIEVTVSEATGLRSAEITKQRDLPGKGDRIGFRLQTVRLGVNPWGNPRTTCVAVPSDAPMKLIRGKRPSEIAGAITEFLRSLGSGVPRKALVNSIDSFRHTSVYREVDKMLKAGLLVEAEGVISLPGKPGVSESLQRSPESPTTNRRSGAHSPTLSSPSMEGELETPTSETWS